ncbi:hypothetical protein SCUP515_06340 [Seiridium cupressi]
MIYYFTSMQLIQSITTILALSSLGHTHPADGDFGAVDTRDLLPRDVDLQSVYKQLDSQGKLKWEAVPDGGELAKVDDATAAKAKREILDEREKRRRDFIERRGSEEELNSLAKRDGTNQVEDASGNQLKAKWYCQGAGSLGFTILRTIGSIMVCRTLDEYYTSSQTGNTSWFWRSPPQEDNSNNVKRDLNSKEMETLEERQGAKYLKMIAAVNKVTATAIKSGMCTGLLGWIVNGVACPASSGTEGATVGGKVSIRDAKANSWFDGKEIAAVEVWAEETDPPK